MSSEAVNQQQIRLDIGKAGMLPLRNNVGACQDQTGRLIRYGLMNESKELNKRFKSSDLIVPRPLLITPEWVGQIVGVFCSIEAKHSDWKFSESDERACAQQRWHELIRSYGGWSGFATSVQEARQILRLPT